MNDSIIVCPKCNADIKLTESLATPLVEEARLELEAKFTARESELLSKLESERAKLFEEGAARTRDAVATAVSLRESELTQTRSRLKEQEARLADAQRAQAQRSSRLIGSGSAKPSRS